MKNFLLFFFITGILSVSATFSQSDVIQNPSRAISNPQPQNDKDRREPNNLIESKSNCAVITDFKEVENELIVHIKNICDKKIFSAKGRQQNGKYILYNFKLEPQKELEHKIYVGGYMVERGFILESVIFEDGEGDGDPDAVKQLQLFYSSYRAEIEKILGFINPLIENPGNDPKRVIQSLKENVNTLPLMFVDMRKVDVGGMVPSAKGTSEGRIMEIEMDKQNNDMSFVLSKLIKLKQELEINLSQIPNFTK